MTLGPYKSVWTPTAHIIGSEQPDLGVGRRAPFRAEQGIEARYWVQLRFKPGESDATGSERANLVVGRSDCLNQELVKSLPLGGVERSVEGVVPDSSVVVFESGIKAMCLRSVESFPLDNARINVEGG